MVSVPLFADPEIRVPVWAEEDTGKGALSTSEFPVSLALLPLSEPVALSGHCSPWLPGRAAHCDW